MKNILHYSCIVTIIIWISWILILFLLQIFLVSNIIFVSLINLYFILILNISLPIQSHFYFTSTTASLSTCASALILALIISAITGTRTIGFFWTEALLWFLIFDWMRCNTFILLAFSYLGYYNNWCILWCLCVVRSGIVRELLLILLLIYLLGSIKYVQVYIIFFIIIWIFIIFLSFSLITIFTAFFCIFRLICIIF